MTLSPGSKLGPYEILSSIASGGMGEVWKARDTRLGRTVAIKIVKEQHSERFKQEARSIAALNHPDICQIFDIGDDYLVLEYVEGKPLSSPLPEQEAVRLAIQIATALEEAHLHGIIHRDLKPSNIMVTDKGSVKLLDFGLAKLYEQDASISSLPTADFPATQAGAILGTVAYMSPEQAQGQPADIRSDIFSFGLVLYEMLSGRRAFSENSASETIAALLRDEPAPLKASPDLERIVKRCLDKQSSARYQTMAEVKAALEKTVKPKVASSSEEPQPSIAVLPFVNMSGDKEQEYFSDGLAEEIINALTKIPGLKVAGRTSSFYFRNKDVEFKEIGRHLEVEHILEGSVRKAGNRLRVTAQLVKVSDGFHLWSERYDRDMEDVFAIQDEISEAITEKLRIHLSKDQKLVKRPTQNVEAYSLYLKGRYYFYRVDPDSLNKSKNCFEKAITIDPNYVLAWYGLSNLYIHLGYLGYIHPEKSMAQTKQAISKTLELDALLPEAHSIRAILSAREYDWKNAEEKFHYALKLDPYSKDVYLTYILHYLLPNRRIDEAIAAAQKSVELEPLAAYPHFLLGFCFYASRQWDLAIEYFNRAIEFDPSSYLPYQYSGFAQIGAGRLEEAIKDCEAAANTVGKGHWALAIPGTAYARAGMTEKAHKLLGELHDLSDQAYVSPSAFTWIYSNLGDVEKALEWFEKAVEKHDGLIIPTHYSVVYDPIRSHPRYKALLRKMNLEP